MTSPRRLATLGLALAAGAVGAAVPPPSPAAEAGANPCLDVRFTGLKCPDLVMLPPFDVTVDKRTRPGRVLLRAGNSIDSVGDGPAMLRGRRSGRRTMRARQHILRRNGRPNLVLPFKARLLFKFIPGQGRYWKWDHAARFELWRLDEEGHQEELVRVGPKAVYCLRDFDRTRPSRRSPRRRRFPGCSQNPRLRAVTLGTSVGWSDIYPAAYHEQWIDVTGLRGRFAYVHIADPKNGIWELDEENNAGEVHVRLPSGRVVRGSRRGRLPRPTGEY